MISYILIIGIQVNLVEAGCFVLVKCVLCDLQKCLSISSIKVPLGQLSVNRNNIKLTKMPQSTFISTSQKNGVRLIKIDRPERKNALSPIMYQTIKNILEEDAANDSIVTTIVTGEKDYFSSGNDIKAAMENPGTAGTLKIVEDFFSAFINYPKLLIAVVNGPAIGAAATVCGLCDIVYASDKAIFDTPFVKLGLCAEGSSSFTFPYTLGRSKASEVILLNHRLGAQEAYQFGMISKVIPHSQLESFIQSLYKYGKLPVNSIMNNKRLVMANLKNILCECNVREMLQVKECIASSDYSNALTAFLGARSKL